MFESWVVIGKSCFELLFLEFYNYNNVWFKVSVNERSDVKFGFLCWKIIGVLSMYCNLFLEVRKLIKI